MSLTPLKYLKFWIFVKLYILRYQFIGITLSKPHLVCTFYNKQINAKKYEWKFVSVQILMARQCILGCPLNFIFSNSLLRQGAKVASTDLIRVLIPKNSIYTTPQVPIFLRSLLKM